MPASFSRLQPAKHISRKPEERDWRAVGQKVTFGFSRALDRDLFMNEVRRLLPANLVRFDAESNNNPAKASALIERPSGR
jgi:hypothetical protein